MEMKKWASKVKRTLEERRGRKSIDLTIASANNHYAGLGPETANIFRNMVGLPEATWSKEEGDRSHLHTSSHSSQDQNSKQSTISDFMA